MEWFNTAPTKLGYYWTRGPSNVVELVQVMDDLRVCRTGDRTRYRVSEFKWWCGPLNAPRIEKQVSKTVEHGRSLDVLLAEPYPHVNVVKVETTV